jgi:hypothetical protein
MHESFEPDSNVTVDRDPHPLKHRWESVSIEDGRQIDERKQQPENVKFPRDETLEFGSNISVSSERHPWKHRAESSSTEHGT